MAAGALGTALPSAPAASPTPNPRLFPGCAPSQTFVPRQAPWPARLRRGARAISEPLATVETARCHLWELWNENVVGSN